MNSGYQGTNCIKVIDDTEAGNLHYVGVYWDGSQGGRSIKIEKERNIQYHVTIRPMILMRTFILKQSIQIIKQMQREKVKPHIFHQTLFTKI